MDNLFIYFVFGVIVFAIFLVHRHIEQTEKVQDCD